MAQVLGSAGDLFELEQRQQRDLLLLRRLQVLGSADVREEPGQNFSERHREKVRDTTSGPGLGLESESGSGFEAGVWKRIFGK